MGIAREGIREIVIAAGVCTAAAAAGAWGALSVSPLFWIAVILCMDLWFFVVLFFRDPDRAVPTEPGLLVSPADGKVTDIESLPRYPGIDGPALRIGIFLSIFDVHVNRSPCAGRILRTQYKPGEFLDARHPRCGERNEAKTIIIEPRESPGGPVIVRQIAGLIARRIICRVREGDSVGRGDRIGLIKFGSRTELIVPTAANLKAAVRINDRVHGGATVVLRPASEAAHGADPSAPPDAQAARLQSVEY
jgi:phosphatidylserine decarboxylase